MCTDELIDVERLTRSVWLPVTATESPPGLTETFALQPGFAAAMLAATALGLGTALVYPTLLAAVSDVAHPSWRASALGVYRLWRDGGYVVGALGAGLLADAVGMPGAIGAVAALTLVSGGVAGVVMRETRPLPVQRAARAPAPAER